MLEKREHSKYVDQVLGDLGLVNPLLNNLKMSSDVHTEGEESLRVLFERQKVEKKLSQRSIQAELDIEYRALNGILDGTQKMVDLLAISRLADFLDIPVEKAIVLLLKNLKKNFTANKEAAGKQDFILKNFDLPKLKKCGFIENTHDFTHIEKVLVEYFGFESIYDFGKEFINVAYSSGKPTSKNDMIRNFWGESATRKLKKINNPYEYDRQGLIEYIPSIRWHSTDVRNGLFQVVRELYKYGVTTIYEPYLTTLYVRGATFPVNDKPCIVLTNYTDYYPSLWFSLMHEIFHVLFDWEEIRQNRPHLSGEIDRFDKKEVEADSFAREYLFSSDKMKVVSGQLNNETFVRRYANAFDVHPSIIYANYCWEKLNLGEDVFKYYQKYLGSAQEALVNLDPNAVPKIAHYEKLPVRLKSKQLKEKLFNGL
jgi:Zn-dependent peptidase ImmA (M78 family)